MKANPKQQPSTTRGKPLYYYARVGVQRGLPPFVRYCIDFLLQHGLKVEGILRLSGSDSIMSDIQKAFAEQPDAELNLGLSRDIMAINVANALKRFIRGLAEPIIPFDSYNQFIAIDDNKTEVTPRKRRLLQTAILSLPKINQIALNEICGLCRAISNESVINLMTSSNCAMVWSPSLMETGRPQEGNMSELGAEIARQQRVIQAMIDDYTEIFGTLAELATDCTRKIKQVNTLLRDRDMQKGDNNHSTLPSSLKEFEISGRFPKDALPTILGHMVPKLGDRLPGSAPPKLRTFEELKKGVAGPATATVEMKLIEESLMRMKMHNLRMEANDMSAIVALLTHSAGLSTSSPELDEIFGLAGRALEMLADWIVIEAQEIFRVYFFTPEWLLNKHNTTIPAMEQLQKLAEENIRPLTSEAHRGVVVSRIIQRLFGQYFLAFALKVPALKTTRVDETKLKMRLKEDDEFLLAAFGVISRFAQSSIQDQEKEMVAVLAAIPSIFAPDIRDVSSAVQTIEKHIGPAEALPVLTEILSLRKDRKHEELLKGLDRRVPIVPPISRWLLDVQVKSVSLIEPPKKCDLSLAFRSGSATVGSTVLKDVTGKNGARSTSEERSFDSVSFELKTAGMFMPKLLGTAQLAIDTVRQELILSSNIMLNARDQNGLEETKESNPAVMGRFREVNRQSIEADTILNGKYFNLELDLSHESQVIGSLSLALRYTRNPYMAMSEALKADVGKHDTLWELNGDPTAESLVDCVVALRDIPDRWHLGVDNYLDKTQGDQEMANGFQAMLAALKDLYYMDDERWVTVRDKVEVGLVKATRNCGNTSVSMGLAEIYLRREMEKPNGRRTVAFLNCGTGGVKMQMYACKKDGVVFAMMEAKPRKCSLSAVQIGGYSPKQKLLDTQGIAQPLQADAFIGMLDEELTKAPWNRPELQVETRKVLDARNQDQPEVFAFVTGSIRGYWEKPSIDAAEKASLEAVMAHIFADRAKPATSIVDPSSKGYFIQQQVEGSMELVAARSMYASIGGAVPQYGDMEVVASLGIGTGSSQWTDRTGAVSIPHGMLSQYLLSNLGRDIVKHYRNPANFEKFLSSLEKTPRPIIALKSGGLLQLYDKKVGAALRSRLCFGDNIDDEEPSRSLARVCAEAGAALKSQEHFLKAEIRGDRIVFLSPYPGGVSFPEFASEGKLEGWQDNPLEMKKP